MTLNLPPFLLFMIFFTSAAYGDQSCDSYPYSINQLIYTKYDNRINVIATCSVLVDFDDIDDQMDSLENAELLAKTELARFLHHEKDSPHHKKSGALAIICDDFDEIESETQSSFSYKLQGVQMIYSCHDEERAITSWKIIRYH